MAGNGSPYKEGWQMVWSIERHLNSDLPPPKCCSIFPFSHLIRKGPHKAPQAPLPTYLAWQPALTLPRRGADIAAISCRPSFIGSRARELSRDSCLETAKINPVSSFPSSSVERVDCWTLNVERLSTEHMSRRQVSGVRCTFLAVRLLLFWEV